MSASCTGNLSKVLLNTGKTLRMGVGTSSEESQLYLLTSFLALITKVRLEGAQHPCPCWLLAPGDLSLEPLLDRLHKEWRSSEEYPRSSCSNHHLNGVTTLCNNNVEVPSLTNPSVAPALIDGHSNLGAVLRCCNWEIAARQASLTSGSTEACHQRHDQHLSGKSGWRPFGSILFTV